MQASPAVFAVLLLCAPDKPAVRHVTPAPVHAEFLYLPGNDRTIADFTADSLFVERRNAKDSCLSSTRVPVSGAVVAQLDSLRRILSAIPSGTYKKEHVIDGTKITIRCGAQTLFCDNCLNDYVMEAAGAPSTPPSGPVADIREAVRLINQVILTVEKKAVAGYMRYEVVLPRGKTADTAKYRIDVVEPPVPVTPRTTPAVPPR